jgi:integrase
VSSAPSEQSIGSLAQNSLSPYREFVKAIKSPATRQLYIQAIHYFMDYLGISRDSYDGLLDRDIKLIQMDICDFIESLKDKKLSFATITSYVAAIHKFYVQNDIITLNWKKIKSSLPEHEKVVEDRPYKQSEIQTLLTNTSLRNRGIILLMCSGGLRLGAIPLLRMRHLEPIDDYSIYKVNVYSRSKKSHYFSFCTPEARKTIDEYIATRRRWGERIEDDSPVFRIDYNLQKTTEVKPISSYAIRDFMGTLLLRTGLRRVPTEGQVKRLDVMMNHGFRKFFESNAFKAGMNNMYIRRLQGQKSGLEDAYLKLEERDLLEGDSKHVGYVGIIDQLTIDDKHRLQKEIQTLRVQKSEMDLLKQKMEEYDKVLGQFMDR